MARFLLALLIAATHILADPPSISGVQNRAGGPLAGAGDVVDILGSNLATDISAASAWPLPTTLLSTQVTCGGFPTPILSVAPDRIRVQLPWELLGLSAASLQVANSGAASPSFQIPLAEFSPTILSADQASVTPGQPLTLRAIGLGPRSANPPTGYGPSTLEPGAVAVHFLVLIGGVPAPVVSTRLANTGDVQSDAGVEAITVMPPFNVPAGDSVPIQIEIGGMTTDPFPAAVNAAAVQVSLIPSSANVPVGSSQRFQVSVAGSSDSTVTWSLDPNSYGGPNAGPSVGTISAGVFSAFYDMPTPPDWTIVRATHASGAFATALVQLVSQSGRAYRIIPESPVIAAGETVTFTLLGPDGSAVDGAAWRMSNGFSNTGQQNNSYTAPVSYPPPQVTVTAVLPGANGFNYGVAATTIFVEPPRVHVTGTSPSVGHVGENLAVQPGDATASLAYIWFTMADGSITRAPASGGAASVPHGAVSGPAWLELTGGYSGAYSGGQQEATFLSAPFPVTILPRLRLHPSRLRVSSGETIAIAAAAPDMPGNWPLTWRADFGSVDSKGRFTAPAVTQPVYARIWACLETNTECGTAIVQVVPFRIEPDPFILNPGEKATLKAWQGGGPVAATWQAATGNVTVQVDGTVTAGAGTFDGGKAVVSATVGGLNRDLNLSIASPGSVADTAEYDDWLGLDNDSATGRLALGAFAVGAVTNGNWIYALSNSLQYHGGPWLGTWIDVYQLDSRHNPVWVDAVEAPYGGGSLYLEGNSLYVIGQEGTIGQQGPNILLQFDVSSGRPVLLHRQLFDGNPTAYHHQGLGFGLVITDQLHPSNQLALQVTDYSTGQTRTLPLGYTPLYDTFNSTVTGTATWAAVMFFYPGASGAYAETVVFDITGSTAVAVGLLASGGFNDSVTAFDNALLVGRDLYEVSLPSVTLAAQLPCSLVLATDQATHRVLMEPGAFWQVDGYRVVDLSDPRNPKMSGPTVFSEQSARTFALGPDYFVLGTSPQNLSVYPVSLASGVRLLDTFPATPFMNDLQTRNGYLYWTGPGLGAEGYRSVTQDLFEVVDISSFPSHVVATLDRPIDEVGWAIQLIGHYAYVGTDSELLVYDVTVPSAPVLSATVATPALSLAVEGNYLYAGSNAGKVSTLLIYDISDPSRPRRVASLPLPDYAYSVATQPGWVAVALGESGLQVYTIANPVSPVLASTFSGKFWGVAGSGNLLYGAADSSGLLIFDLSQPKTPLVLSRTSLAAGDEVVWTTYFPAATALSLDPRGIAWLCTEKDGRVYGLDVRSPSQPRHVAEFVTGTGVYPAQNTASSNGLLIIAGNDAAFDTSTSQNIGLYEVEQPLPGQVLPDRFNDVPPLAVGAAMAHRPLKARALRQGRRMVIERPHSGPAK